MNKFLILVFLILIAGCGRQDNSLPVIDTQASKTRVVNLSEVFEKDEMIILETNDSCLISYITQVIKTKEAIYILDIRYGAFLTSRILKFDKAGRFIRQIGTTGNGPGEYHLVTAIAYDSLNHNIIAVSEKDILEYDLDGNLIEYYPTRINSHIDNIYLLNDTVWLLNHEMNYDIEEKISLFFYHNKQKQDSILLHQYKSDTKVLLTSQNTPVISDLAKARYIYYPVRYPEPFLRDTLYEIKGRKFLPSLKLDFSAVLKVSNETLPQNLPFREWIKESMRIRNISLMDIYRTNRFLVADYLMDSTLRKFCYDFKKLDGFNLEYGFHDDWFGSQQPINPLPMDLNNGQFFFSMNSMYIMDKIPGINENSNPVLFFLKIKS
ncbi:MAG TPA: 6-bladed beta-propeller [Bacteroidales bacterium]|nr:6-bladed beta-propeller [Bacteroidales bacterium]